MTDRYENIRAALGLLDSEDYCERAIGYSKLRNACAPDTIRALLAERDALERDAKRWKFCEEHDAMPVIANDGRTWCMFVAVKNRTRSLFRGSTPGEAVDAAIAAANGGGDG